MDTYKTNNNSQWEGEGVPKRFHNRDPCVVPLVVPLVDPVVVVNNADPV